MDKQSRRCGGKEMPANRQGRALYGKKPSKQTIARGKKHATLPQKPLLTAMIHTPWQYATTNATYDPARILCYDSEFVRERSYIPKLALVQTCQPGGSAQLYDPLEGDIPWATILLHPAPLVMHAAAQDLELMQLCGGALPATIRDTQIGFALCSPHLAASYATLVEHYLGIVPDKSQTRSDWLARPLNAAQLDYAADDVGLLARLYPLLVADLQRLGRLAWWAEESATQLARQQQTRDAWHWYRLQGAPQLRHDDKPVAQILVEARERLAAQQQAIAKQAAETRRWQNLHELIGAADGKKYRNYAQSLTFASVIAQANRQLVQLSDRYLLTADPARPLELNIIDNYQGGETRSAKNLSGGESFIVSLALALGLAQMSGENMQIDTLFLDEGFGTLDEETLDSALETLAQLRTHGKHIGIISHVAALTERIATRIQITPQNGGNSIISGPGCRRVE